MVYFSAHYFKVSWMDVVYQMDVVSWMVYQMDVVV
jgi:hypothetical protein